MFQYDAGSKECLYFPHLQLKDKRWLDFLVPDDLHDDVSKKLLDTNVDACIFRIQKVFICWNVEREQEQILRKEEIS